MYHCDKRGKGIHIRGGRLVNVLLRSDSSYERMLAKCVEEIFPEEDKDKFDFYIEDSRGAEVWNGDNQIHMNLLKSQVKCFHRCLK